MKIKNIEDLRNYVLDSLEKLSSNKIDVTEAGVIAKSSETIMSSLKLQLSYSSMIGDAPMIPFLQDSHQGTPIQEIEKDNVKQLTDKKSKAS
jgi:hypothetical protein